MGDSNLKNLEKSIISLFLIVLLLVILFNPVSGSYDPSYTYPESKYTVPVTTPVYGNGTDFRLATYLNISNSSEIAYANGQGSVYIDNIVNNSLIRFKSISLVQTNTLHIFNITGMVSAKLKNTTYLAVLDNAGYLHMFNLSSFKQAWTVKIGTDPYSSTMPQLLTAGMLLNNSIVIALNRSAVLGYNVLNGKLNFTIPLPFPSSVAIANNQSLIIGGNGYLKIFDFGALDGSKTMKFNSTVTTLTHSKNLLYAGFDNGTVAQINITLNYQITKYFSLFNTSILKISVLNTTALAIATYGKLDIASIQNGTVIFDFNFKDLNDFEPVSYKNQTLLFLTQGNITGSSSFENLILFDLHDYSVVYNSYSYEFSDIAYASVNYNNNSAAALLSNYGTLFLFDPFTNKNVVIANTTFTQPRAMNYYNNLFFVGNESGLYVYNITNDSVVWNITVPDGVSSISTNGIYTIFSNYTGYLYLYENRNLIWIDKNVTSVTGVRTHLKFLNLNEIVSYQSSTYAVLRILTVAHQTLWKQVFSGFNLSASNLQIFSNNIAIILNYNNLSKVFVFSNLGKLESSIFLNSSALQFYSLGLYKQYLVTSVSNGSVQFYNMSTYKLEYQTVLPFAISIGSNNYLPLLNLTVSDKTYLYGINNNRMIGLTLALKYELPKIIILSPSNSQTINIADKVLNISGSANITNGEIVSVQVSINNGTWNLANGTINWHYLWAITSLSPGNYTIIARAYDGWNYSYSTVTVTLVSTAFQAPSKNTGWIFEMLVVGTVFFLIALALILYIYRTQKKRRELELYERKEKP